MNNLLEQIKERVKQSWEQFQGTESYQKLAERFEELSPNGQKAVLLGGAFFMVMVIAYSPLDTLSLTSDYVNEFESKRELTRELLKSAKDASQIPQLPFTPKGTALVSQIQSLAQQNNFLPEQIESVTESSTSSALIPNHLSSGAVRAQFRKLNIRQIIDLGYKVAQISQSLKMNRVRIIANTEVPGLFDFFFEVTALKSPQISMADQQDQDSENSQGSDNSEEGEE